MLLADMEEQICAWVQFSPSGHLMERYRPYRCADKSNTLASLAAWLTQHECKSHHPYPSPNRAESEINITIDPETITQIHDKMNDRVLVSDLRAKSRNQKSISSEFGQSHM